MITGASSGIGRALALRLKGKASLFLMARNPERLQQIAGECGAAAVPGDVRNFADCERLVSAATGSQMALVTCAGTAYFGDFSEMSVEHIIDQLDTNLKGTMLAVRAALPVMLAQYGRPSPLTPLPEKGEGNFRIVSVLSIAATQTMAGAAAYSAAKAGALAFMRSINLEYRAKGIACTSVILGATDTPLWDDASFVPERADMLSSDTVAEVIEGLLFGNPNRAVDEIVLMPPKGVL